MSNLGILFTFLVFLSCVSAAQITVTGGKSVNSGPTSAIKLAVIATQTPLADKWTVMFNSSGASGGGLYLNNWNAAQANVNVTSGTTTTLSSPLSYGTIVGYTTYANNVGIKYLLEHNLYVLMPNLLGNKKIWIEVKDNSGNADITVFNFSIQPLSISSNTVISKWLVFAVLVIGLVILL